MSALWDVVIALSWAIVFAALPIYIVWQIIRDWRRRSYVMAAFGALCLAGLLCVPIKTHAVKLDMPGVTKEDVKIAVEGRQVTVHAQTTHVEEKKDGERLLYRERAASRYARTFTLPVEVDQGEAAARLEHGVLTLTLPKRSARSAAQIPVN